MVNPNNNISIYKYNPINFKNKNSYKSARSSWNSDIEHIREAMKVFWKGKEIRENASPACQNKGYNEILLNSINKRFIEPEAIKVNQLKKQKCSMVTQIVKNLIIRNP